MKHIKKGTEPEELLQYRNYTPNASYEGFSSKQAVREALVLEQGAICAYCMQRIHLDISSDSPTDIEHYHSQDNHPELQLDYTNMLGVCKGNSQNKAAAHLYHCDKSKDQPKNKPFLPLTVNPLERHSVDTIRYRSDGTIYSENETINDELDIILNLNEPNLVTYRKQVIAEAKLQVRIAHGGKDYTGTYRKALIQRIIDKWESLYLNKRTNLPSYRPFCMAAVYQLKRLLRKAQ